MLLLTFQKRDTHDLKKYYQSLCKFNMKIFSTFLFENKIIDMRIYLERIAGVLNFYDNK